MKIAVGSDHGGYPLKQIVMDELNTLGHEVIDCGADHYSTGDGSRIIGEELARALMRTLVTAQFSTDPRFQRRLDKVLHIEREHA